jgi:hypothetical protein
MNEEIWKTIEEFPNYQVSSFGNVKNIVTEKYKAKNITKFGYERTDLYNNGFHKTMPIHKLVVEAFISKRPMGKQINHIDGNKKNNCLDNLEYVTRSENILHAFRIGLIKVDAAWIEKSKLASKKMHEMYDFSGENNPSFGVSCSDERKQKISNSNKGKLNGSKNPRSKLTEKEVLKIREMYSTGEYKQIDLAKMFGIDQTQISCIVLKKNWSHV